MTGLGDLYKVRANKFVRWGEGDGREERKYVGDKLEQFF